MRRSTYFTFLTFMLVSGVPIPPVGRSLEWQMRQLTWRNT